MKWHKTKRGVVVTTTLVKITILLISFMLIAGSIARFASKVDEKESEAICRSSVDIRASTLTSAKIAGIGVEDIKTTPILCKTIDKELSGDREEVMDELSEMMTRCWWMFRLGKTQDLFKSVPGTSRQNFGQVCYTALIKEIDDDRKYFTGDELLAHMADKKHKDMQDGNYIDYIQNGGGPGRILMVLTQDTEHATVIGTDGGAQDALREGIAGQGIFQQGVGYEIAFIEKSGEANDWISNTLLGGGAVTAIGGAFATYIGIQTGGIAVILYGVGTLAVGSLATYEGGKIKLEELFNQDKVSTLLVLDISEEKLRRELHSKVLLADIAGE
jgi:hypothetical protein